MELRNTPALGFALLGVLSINVGNAQKKPKCAASLDVCPSVGCVEGDGNLNKQKNKVEEPHSGSVEEMTISEIVGLEEPDSWTKGKTRGELKDLGEGKAIVVKGYLIHAKVSAAETPNCRLTGQSNNDFHLNIVRRKTDPREESLVIEMTPRVRAIHAEWTFKAISALADEEDPPYVRVTGWLLLDTEHLSGNGGPRATEWEIHPITKFEVCGETRKSCDAGNGWKNLDEQWNPRSLQDCCRS